MRSQAASVEEYIKELPVDRVKAFTMVRQTMLSNLPSGYLEVMN